MERAEVMDKTSRKLNFGEFVHTFTVFPDMLNYSGTLFGGKLLSEMDVAASNAARKMLYNTPCNGLVTAHLGEVNFTSPGLLGDIVELKCLVTHLGNSSITIEVQVAKEDQYGHRDGICNAKFVFVALRDGKPYPHGQKMESLN